MKKIFLALALIAAAPAFGQETNSTKLVYPVAAANSELDNSTPMKRVEPPTREENEIDPVSPIGQIQLVRDSLARLEKVQEEMRLELGRDDDALFSRLRDATREQFDSLFQKNSDDVAALMKTTSGIAAKLDALQQTTENLRATVEAAQKTAESIERIRTSKWTDYAVLAILALVLIQLLCRFATFFVNRVKTTRSRIEELVEAYTITKQQLAEAKAKPRVKTTKK